MEICGEMDNMSDMKYNRITEGVIWKELILFSLPIMLGTLFQQLYNAVDVIVVGQFCRNGSSCQCGRLIRLHFESRDSILCRNLLRSDGFCFPIFWRQGGRAAVKSNFYFRSILHYRRCYFIYCRLCGNSRCPSFAENS